MPLFPERPPQQHSSKPSTASQRRLPVFRVAHVACGHDLLGCLAQIRPLALIGDVAVAHSGDHGTDDVTDARADRP